MKFPRVGFRRITHKKDANGKIYIDENAVNIWQSHIYNCSYSKYIAQKIPIDKVMLFKDIVKECRKDDEWYLDKEEIAIAILELLECKMIVAEEAESYETTIYDEGNKFWKK